MENPKLRSYNRYRRIANSVLCAAVLVLSGALFLESRGYFPRFLTLIAYLAEAVLVASAADFIAILALTTPIPGLRFTGLIQRKRKELVAGFVNACETRILPRSTILEMLGELDFILLMKQHLDSRVIREEAPAIGKALARFLRQETPLLSRTLARGAVNRFRAVDSGKVMAWLETLALREGWPELILRNLFEKLSVESARPDFVDELEAKIRRAVERNRVAGGMLKRVWNSFKTWAGERSDTINYRELAENLASALQDVLETVGTEGESPRMQEMTEFVAELLGNLSVNAPFLRDLEEWQHEVLDEKRLEPRIAVILQVLADWLEDGRLTGEEINRTLQFQLMNESAEEVNITRWLGLLLLEGLEALEKNDRVVRAEFGKLTHAFVEKEYTSVLEIIRDVLSRLSDHGLAEKVNEVAGSNLQWLRISGAYVGFATGLLLFLITLYPRWGVPLLLLLTAGVLFVDPVRRRLVVLSSGHRN